MVEIKRRTFLLGALGGALVPQVGAASSGPRISDLAQLLRGRWKHKGIAVRYELVSGGSTILERWETKTSTSLTLYHEDNGALIATHYCPQGNQPRLRATSTTKTGVHFTLLDATNKRADQEMLVDLRFRFEPDAIVRRETYRNPQGKELVSKLRFVPAKAI